MVDMDNVGLSHGDAHLLRIGTCGDWKSGAWATNPGLPEKWPTISTCIPTWL